jgi:cytochrome bd ubiquinol oxidase subunit II
LDALLSAAPILFAAAVAFCVVVYVVADGFDLGVGILFLAAPREEDRDVMMASIEPVWDANETWLVMGGTLLFAAFPAGYYGLLPAFYLPIMFMLFALIFRGVAFAFRLQTIRFRMLWNIAFAGGSILAALCQGFVLGGLIDGVPMQASMFAGVRSVSSAYSASCAASDSSAAMRCWVPDG